MISIWIKAVWNFFNSCRNIRKVSVTISTKSEKKKFTRYRQIVPKIKFHTVTHASRPHSTRHRVNENSLIGVSP